MTMNMKITRTSIFTGQTRTMDLPIEPDQWTAYAKGDLLIQDAFPQLSASQREFILSGMTEEEWEEAFGGEEE